MSAAVAAPILQSRAKASPAASHRAQTALIPPGPSEYAVFLLVSRAPAPTPTPTLWAANAGGARDVLGTLVLSGLGTSHWQAAQGSDVVVVLQELLFRSVTGNARGAKLDFTADVSRRLLAQRLLCACVVPVFATDACKLSNASL